MPVDVLMPNLGFDTQTGRLIEWLKQPGDPVAKGEAIAVVESDKANVELEALAGGVLLEQRARPDEEVAIGAVIARIGSAAEYQPAAAPASSAQPAPSAQPTSAAQTASASRVSPVANRMARDLQVDPDRIAGSGARGRVVRRDVEAFSSTQQSAPPAGENGVDGRGVKALPKVRRAARERGIDLAAVLAAGFANPIRMVDLDAYAAQTTATPAPREEAQPASTPALKPATAPGGATAIPLSRARQTIGRRLSESMRDAPHFYVTGEFDFDAAVARLGAMGQKVRINDLLLYLTVQTLLRVPALNRTYQDGTLYQHEGVHLAIAVAREDGLITPVLHDAGRFSLQGLAVESRALVERARANRLTVEDLTGGSFTISNMGMVQQVERFTAVINPPQVGILAVGSLKARPVVRDGGLFARQTAYLTLSGDHRVVDGMDLARFMSVFEEELIRFSA